MVEAMVNTLPEELAIAVEPAGDEEDEADEEEECISRWQGSRVYRAKVKAMCPVDEEASQKIALCGAVLELRRPECAHGLIKA